MFKKICGALSTLLLIILALLAAVMIVPHFLGYKSMAVLTGSMEPNYPVGSLVYVKETDPEDIQVNDVITYQLSGDTVVTHRVVAVDRDLQQFTTKGDANEAEDGAPVPYTNVVGRAEFNLPYVGFISIYAKTPIGIGIICAVLVVIILLTFLPEIFSEEEESGDKSDHKQNKKKKKKVE